MALIIDATNGTVLDTSNCYILHDDQLSWEQEHALESGSPEKIAELAKSAGVPMEPDAMEWVRYGRTTSVSYGPSYLREEAKVLLETMRTETDEDLSDRGNLEWVVNKAHDAELEFIAQHILEDDAVWNGYKENLIEGLRWYETYEPF